MENTKDNFEKFMANYWGLYIGNYIGRSDIQVNMNTICHIKYLNLTPLHLITDEDAIEMSKIFNPEWKNADIKYNDGKTITIANDRASYGDIIDIYSSDGEIYTGDLRNYASYFYLSAYDFLRSKGYALPFNGLSVSEQVERGWVKLTAEL